MSYINSININFFRNLKKAEMKINSRVLCLYGDNAQGKTNILESIFLLANPRSFRQGNINDWIIHNGEQACVKADIKDNLGSYSLKYELDKEERRYYLNNKGVKSFKELLDVIRIVSYTPLSFELVLLGSEIRRMFIDRVVYSLDTKHYDDMVYLNNLLKNRNKAIRTKQDFTLWDEMLAEVSIRISERRKMGIKVVEEYLAPIFNEFFPKSEKLNIKYSPSLEGTKEAALVKIKSKKEIDAKKGSTTVGSHRDFLEIMVGNDAARNVVSTGQVKLISFLLKIAKCRIFKQTTGENPIFLFDDASAFLDDKRFLQLVEIINKEMIQIIISSVDKNLFKGCFSDNVQFVKVSEGSLQI